MNEKREQNYFKYLAGGVVVNQDTGMEGDIKEAKRGRESVRAFNLRQIRRKRIIYGGHMILLII